MEISIQSHVPATLPSVNFTTSVRYAPNFALREVVAAARRVQTYFFFTDIMRTHYHRNLVTVIFMGTFHVVVF